MKRFNPVPTDDKILSKIQDAITQAFGEIDRLIPFLDGVRVSGVTIGASSTQVAHGLKRRPIGWWVVTRDANQEVWQASASTDLFLNLQAGGAVSVDLWVF